MSGISTDVMFVRPTLERGGAEKMLAFVANSCAGATGFGKTWLVTTHSQILGYQLETGVEHISLWRNESSMPCLLPQRLGRYALALLDLRRLIRTRQPDVVCAFGVKYTLLCVVACLGLPAKIVGAERGSPAHLGTLWKAITGWAYRLADGVVFQLPAVRDAFRAATVRSTVIPNPYISESTVEPPPIRMRQPVVVAAFARWDESKGVDVLLRAFGVVAKDRPEFTLNLIGPSEGMEKYQALALELGIDAKVTFLEPVLDVAAAVRLCRVFVLPSRHEGIPNVLLEVMGAGLPVVACDCPPGGPRLLTANGERGLLVPVDDVDAMADAISRVGCDDALASRLSSAALRVRDEFSVAQIRERWLDFFTLVASLEPSW